MDKTTLPGLLIGLVALIVTILLEGGNPMAMLNLPAATVVFGGSLGVALVAFPLGRLLLVPKLIGKSMADKQHDEGKLVDLFVDLAEKARREGLLALEAQAGQIENPFVKKGIMLVVDGTDPEVVRGVLEAETIAMSKRHQGGYAVFDALGGFAPTLGIIGTVMGLVNVLSHLDNPDELGHSIATAFLATLYGVGSANLIWLPLGNKLKVKSKQEAELRELAVEGVLAVQAGDNPRIVREKLEAFLPPAHRGKATEPGSDAARSEAA